MRDKPNTPPPATTQAPPASSTFDPRLWVPLKIAFRRYVDFAGGRIVGAQNEALDYINLDMRAWRLRLGFRAPDNTIRVPDAEECQKLTVKATPNWEEDVWIAPRCDEPCYAWRADLNRRTTFPTAPAPAAEPEPAPAVEPELAKAEPTRWQRDPVIQAMKSFYPPDGIRPKGVSLAALTDRINKLPEFKAGNVSEDTVTRADAEIKAAHKK